jgi:hypothetical protein
MSDHVQGKCTTSGWKVRANDSSGKQHTVFVANRDPDAARNLASEVVPNTIKTELLETVSSAELSGLLLSDGDVSVLTLFDDKAK